MIEPRGITAHIHRRDSSAFDGTTTINNASAYELVEHDEPERPIHPALEYETLATRDVVDALEEDASCAETAAQQSRRIKKLKLLVSCIFLVIAGTGNAVAAKLQAIPMYNYPNFLNLFSNLMYIPICFAYIIPVARYRWFHNNAISPQQQLAISKRPFIVMGALDCLATSMQVFSSIYLPGPLLVLLSQAAVPCSMVLSRYIRREWYLWTQYLGAVVVVVGILVVLEPVVTQRRAPEYYCEAVHVNSDCTVCRAEASRDSCLSHTNQDNNNNNDPMMWMMTVRENSNSSDTLCQWIPFQEAVKEEEALTFVWSLVMLASVLPMTLSTMYKEAALGGTIELDPVYLNGWIAVFQFLFSLILAVPFGVLASPRVGAVDLPENIWNGARCFAGHGSIDSGCHPDTMCSFQATLFVCLALICNVVYTTLLLFVLKYGSTSLLFLALTLMVPVSNVAFCLPFMPQATEVHGSDLLGLAVIVSGLILYRFLDPRPTDNNNSYDSDQVANDPADSTSALTPWFQDWIRELQQDDEPLPLRNDGDVLPEQQLREPLLESGDV